MRIALGADHAGVDLKNHVRSWLERNGWSVSDVGTQSGESVDYPDYAVAVARQVAAGDCTRGLLFCGSGIGMAIAANKVPGIRAAATQDARTTQLCREHNDANVLALGARLTSAEDAEQLITVFLTTPFAGGRHDRRIEKLAALDQAPR